MAHGRRNAYLDASLDEGSTARGTWHVMAVLESKGITHKIRVTLTDGNVRRTPREPKRVDAPVRQFSRLESTQRILGDREHPRSQLILAISTHRHRASRVEARARMEHRVPCGTRHCANDSHAQMARDDLRMQAWMPVRRCIEKGAIVPVVGECVPRRMLGVDARDVALRRRERLIAPIDECRERER